jgi:rhodanese-related sulfurtransferase
VTDAADVSVGTAWQGGHIPGSMWVPSRTFFLTVEDVAAELAHVDAVVVHCMYSQQRGPACAALLQATLDAIPGARARVYVLRGGFAGWQQACRDDPARAILLEAYEPSLY